jgi:hypothetical protein
VRGPRWVGSDGGSAPSMPNLEKVPDAAADCAHRERASGVVHNAAGANGGQLASTKGHAHAFELLRGAHRPGQRWSISIDDMAVRAPAAVRGP